MLSAPAVPIRTVSAKEMSDAEDAEEYYRQARVAEKQAELNQIRQKNRDLNEVDSQVAAEANKFADEVMVETFKSGGWRNEVDVAVSQSHKETILEYRKRSRRHEAVETERLKANAERTAEEIVELRSLQAEQRLRPDRPFVDPEMDDIPQGVTQTNQKMPNGEGIVITRVVRVGNVIKRYRKVITKLGTFYYLRRSKHHQDPMGIGNQLNPLSMGLAKQALVYTLVVHVVVLGAMLVWPVSETQPLSEVFAEVDMVDEVLEQPVQSYEDVLKQSLQDKVANLRANAESALSRKPSRAKLSTSPSSRPWWKRNCGPWNRPSSSGWPQRKKSSKPLEKPMSPAGCPADLRTMGCPVRWGGDGAIQLGRPNGQGFRCAWLHL